MLPKGAMIPGILLAYDTDQRRRKEGLANEFTLEPGTVEAGARLQEGKP
jgi:hypothetical protein